SEWSNIFASSASMGLDIGASGVAASARCAIRGAVRTGLDRRCRRGIRPAPWKNCARPRRPAMRRVLFAGLALAAPQSAATAQSSPTFAVVADPGVKLRAGPSDQFPETSTLPRGFKLLVHQDEPNGWVAVTDAPGQVNSISWVQTQFIDFDKN